MFLFPHPVDFFSEIFETYLNDEWTQSHNLLVPQSFSKLEIRIFHVLEGYGKIQPFTQKLLLMID